VGWALSELGIGLLAFLILDAGIGLVYRRRAVAPV